MPRSNRSKPNVSAVVYRRAGVEVGASLPAWAWPGGYPMIYVTNRGDVLCAVCASTNTDEDAVTACDIHYEGPVEQCVNCSTLIPSAYGDPDADESEDPMTRWPKT